MKFPKDLVDLFEACFGATALNSTQTGALLTSGSASGADVLDMFEQEFGSYALANSPFADVVRAL